MSVVAFQLLTSYEENIFFLLKNLLASHDIVAQRDYLPKLRDVPVEVDEDEETVKLVQLVKSQEPLVRNLS